MQRLILASKSPRRKELLDLLEKSYDVIVSEVDETINLEGDLRKEIEKLAFRKAQKVFLEIKMQQLLVLILSWSSINKY